MKQKFEKNMRILGDLVSYCHQIGAKDYHMDLISRDGTSYFTIRAGIAHLHQNVIDDLMRDLNLPRQQEVEQNYWGLTGEVETDCELTLVGMMIDTASVDYTNGVLTINAKRID